ncbi:duplicated carbonic anhydrase [Babesia ovis]|uniref:Duplicated carbonic anhydrase n=1 Tax=Babesia ovis TaxID=5869 RepID=A0A9W5WTR8_BABOV|nr:duplicated carbonic anhydrase [Babesia ovis]
MESSKWSTNAKNVGIYRFSLVSTFRRMLSVVLLVTVFFNPAASLSVKTQDLQSSSTASTNEITNTKKPTVHVHQANRKSGPNGRQTVPHWDYARHGADWRNGMCSIGRMQSPVDLHVDGLVTSRPQNLKSLFDAVLSNSDIADELKDGWHLGDVVYSYRPLISSVKVLRTDKVFRLSIPANEGSAFGTLFTTDRPNLYTATHIEFHSPSEHTFEGSANRRQVEVQIWHYYGEDASSDTGIHGLEASQNTDLNVPVNPKTHSAPPKRRTNNVVGTKETQTDQGQPSKSALTGGHASTTETGSGTTTASGVHSASAANTHKKNGVTNTSGGSQNFVNDIVDTDGHKVDANHLFHETQIDITPNTEVYDTFAIPQPNQRNNNGYSHELSHMDTDIEKRLDEYLSSDKAGLHDFENEKDMRDTNLVDYPYGPSFIEIASDVEMADGTHVVYPPSEQYRFRTSKQDAATTTNNEANENKGYNWLNHESNATEHPLKSDKSIAAAGMLEKENFDLLHKYLVDHLNNAAYNAARDHRHIAGKRRARDIGTHWGRWAVLSLTFMSEEMSSTRIETLKTFPSERFMEQVLDIGSSVVVQEDTGSPSVGDLGSEGSSDLPVVDLDSPINLPSLLLMLETKDLNYFAYDGSFTRPGCEETVRWYVAKEPLPISTELMLQINRMLNQKREHEQLSEVTNKYRELQNVGANMHNTGRVHLVHAYPMEYFVASSLEHSAFTPPVKASRFLIPSVGFCITMILMLLVQL